MSGIWGIIDSRYRDVSLIYFALSARCEKAGISLRTEARSDRYIYGPAHDLGYQVRVLMTHWISKDCLGLVIASDTEDIDRRDQTKVENVLPIMIYMRRSPNSRVYKVSLRPCPGVKLTGFGNITTKTTLRQNLAAKHVSPRLQLTENST